MTGPRPTDPAAPADLPVGVVVIGRNEGQRLLRCLKSVLPVSARVVYVDSGSTDGSVQAAQALGVDTVALDMSIPFCAARARNEGAERLKAVTPGLAFIQFIDGDCELDAAWVQKAVNALLAEPRIAVVGGWLQERSPEVSVYNRMGNIQRNVAGTRAAGDVDSVGGIFMIRRPAFDAVGGFDPTVPAGEEPEMCQRLRAAGWRIHRLNANMALHDLAMTHFGQWWKRQVRSGYGSMDVAQRFQLPSFARNNLRVRLWSAWLAMVAVLAGWQLWQGGAHWLLAGVLALWPLQAWRIARNIRSRGQPWSDSLIYGFFLMLSFWPQMKGQAMFMWDRWRNRGARLVEYKSPEPPAGGNATRGGHQ